MTIQTDDTATARSSIEVGAPPDRAFQVFTAGFDRWWNRAHHLLEGELAEVGIEPFVDGRVWERSTAGDECTWGRVLTWDPPGSFAFSWLIGPDWAVPAADAPGSRVTVTFTPVDAGTRVDLVHDRIDAHGTGWESIRDSVRAEGGWSGLLRLYAAHV